MTRMKGPDCAVVRNLINTHTHALGRINASSIYNGEDDRTGLRGYVCGVQFNVLGLETNTYAESERQQQ